MSRSLSNTPFVERWTCPECYADHRARVILCSDCGTPLRCTIESQPVAICTIVDPNDEDGDDA